MTEARGELATTTHNNLRCECVIGEHERHDESCILYLYQHLEPGDPLEGQDEEGGQRKPLADGVLFQAGQDTREPRVFLPRRQRKTKSKKRA